MGFRTPAGPKPPSYAPLWRKVRRDALRRWLMFGPFFVLPLAVVFAVSVANGSSMGGAFLLLPFPGAIVAAVLLQAVPFECPRCGLSFGTRLFGYAHRYTCANCALPRDAQYDPNWTPDHEDSSA